MIRCHIEVTETNQDKKAIESRHKPSIASRRLAFEELVMRDELRWRSVQTPAELRCMAELVQRELKAGEFQRFVDWMCVGFGHAFVRAAGLPVGRPRLELAS